MRFLCRIGIHKWSKWVAGGTTDHYDIDFPKYPYKTTRRFYRECESCGWIGRRSRKE